MSILEHVLTMAALSYFTWQATGLRAMRRELAQLAADLERNPRCESRHDLFGHCGRDLDHPDAHANRRGSWADQ